MALSVDNFGSEVLRRPTNGHCRFILCQDFREAEVRELHVTAFVNQDVFWFEASNKLAYTLGK